MNREVFIRLLKRLLYPHPIIVALLVPIACVGLVLAFTLFGQESIPAILCFVLAAYTLTVVSVRVPDIIKALRTFKRENKYMVRWFSDEHLRVLATTLVSLTLNVAFAFFQLGLGILHGSFWYYSFAVYYLMLAIMRIALTRYMRGNKILGNLRAELVRYRICAVVFLLMNLTLSLIVFFMVYWGRTFVHHEITVIAMAAYTFTSFTLAIISIVKYRKYSSPVYSATKAISLASACVSVLTLEASMLTAFGGEELDALTRRLLLSLTGAAISVFLILMAVNMIYISSKRLAELKKNPEIPITEATQSNGEISKFENNSLQKEENND